MRKLSLLVGTAVIVLLCGFAAAAQSAKDRGRHDAFKCNGTLTGAFHDVVVPPNGVCVLTNSTVRENVEVRKNAYFQADNTKIRDDVRGDHAQTVFINTGSSVGGGVETRGGAQLFVYNATVKHDIRATNLTNKVEICGTTVSRGGVDIERLHGGGNEILIGDPLTVGCPRNTVSRESVKVEMNFTDVYFVIRGNTISHGNLLVTDNTGTSDKFVQTNNRGKTLNCTGNTAPFVGGPNGTWTRKRGQCF